MDIAVIGYGSVGHGLGSRSSDLGHRVVYGVRDSQSQKIFDFVGAAPGRHEVRPVPEVIEQAEIVVLATAYPAAPETARRERERLSSKLVVDCTNPIGPGLAQPRPKEGLGALAAGSQKGVEAFNTCGYENFRDSRYPSGSQLEAAILWIHMGRIQGRGSNFTWAVLRR